MLPFKEAPSKSTHQQLNELCNCMVGDSKRQGGPPVYFTQCSNGQSVSYPLPSTHCLASFSDQEDVKAHAHANANANGTPNCGGTVGRAAVRSAEKRFAVW